MSTVNLCLDGNINFKKSWMCSRIIGFKVIKGELIYNVIIQFEPLFWHSNKLFDKIRYVQRILQIKLQNLISNNYLNINSSCIVFKETGIIASYQSSKFTTHMHKIWKQVHNTCVNFNLLYGSLYSIFLYISFITE